MGNSTVNPSPKVEWGLLLLTLGKDAPRLLGDQVNNGFVTRVDIERVYHGLPDGPDRTRLARFIAVRIQRPTPEAPPTRNGEVELRAGSAVPKPKARTRRERQFRELQAQKDALAAELVSLRAQVQALTPPPPPPPEEVIAKGLADLKAALEGLRPPGVVQPTPPGLSPPISHRSAQAMNERAGEAYQIDMELLAALEKPSHAELRAWVRESERALRHHAGILEDAKGTSHRLSSITNGEMHDIVWAAIGKHGELVRHLESRLKAVKPVLDPLPFGRPMENGEATPPPEKQAIDEMLAEFLNDLSQGSKKSIVDKVVRLMPVSGSIKGLFDWRTKALQDASEIHGQLSLGRAFGYGSFQSPTMNLDARQELEAIVARVERAIEAAGIAV